MKYKIQGENSETQIKYKEEIVKGASLDFFLGADTNKIQIQGENSEGASLELYFGSRHKQNTRRKQWDTNKVQEENCELGLLGIIF